MYIIGLHQDFKGICIKSKTNWPSFSKYKFTFYRYFRQKDWRISITRSEKCQIRICNTDERDQEIRNNLSSDLPALAAPQHSVVPCKSPTPPPHSQPDVGPTGPLSQRDWRRQTAAGRPTHHPLPWGSGTRCGRRSPPPAHPDTPLCFFQKMDSAR